jgi:hypothetical protein
VAEPPAPVQLNVNVPLAVSAPVAAVPDVALAPDQAPEAVHEVALVVLHVNVELPPDTTLVGFALKLTVGAGVVTVTVADAEPLPPVPVQLRV